MSYLPENLFVNTCTGIIIVLNRTKPSDRQDKFFLINASQKYAKGDPKNYIPEDSIIHIADTFKEWREEDKFSRIIEKADIVKNDYNISPSRYIYTGEAEEYRPIEDILNELELLEQSMDTINQQIRNVIKKVGY